MLKSDVIAFFGNGSRVAKALGIGKQAVSAWGERVPPFRAAQLAKLTNNKLRFDLDAYRDWYKSREVA